MIGPNTFKMAHGEYPNSARTQNPLYVLVKLNSTSAILNF